MQNYKQLCSLPQLLLMEEDERHLTVESVANHEKATEGDNAAVLRLHHRTL